MTIYVAMRYRAWDGALEPSHDCIVAHLPVKVEFGKSCGFLMCYESVEAMKEEYPDASYFTVETHEESDNG